MNGAADGGTGAQENYQYNKRLQPALIQLVTTDNPPEGYCLVYNYYSGVSNPSSCAAPTQSTTNNGNVMGYWYQDSAQTGFAHTATYGYDGVNRLGTPTAKTLGGTTLWSYTYSYDRWGNGTCSPGGVDCPALTYNGQNNNQLATIGSYSFYYDAAGNLTRDPSNYPAQPVRTYQWDAEGRVASVDGGSTYSFTYNALGHRVQWAYTGGANQHLFDPEGGWLGLSGSYDIVRFGDRFMLVYRASETSFNHVNNIGSTSMLTSHTGAASEDVTFYPWGDVWNSWGTGGYNFAELPIRDWTMNTDLTLARMSSPNFARWFSPDPENAGAHPSDPQTWNMYAYVRNNPTTLVDPAGLYICGSSMSSEQCDAFQAALDEAQAAADKMKAKYGENSQQYIDLQGAISSYGERGVDNGVQINIGNTGGVPGNTFADYSHLQTVEDPTGQNIQVTFRGGGNPLLSNPNSDEAVMAVAHEGIHVQDAEDWASRGFTDEPTLLQTEFRAYGVTSLVGEARGAAILIGTSPPPNPNNTQFPFWSKGYSQPVNNMLRTGMIKAINPQWALGAWTRNTQGGGD